VSAFVGAENQSNLTAKPDYQFLTINEVCKILKISRSTIYRKINPKNPAYDPSFPKPAKFGESCTRWADTEILTWIEANLNKRTVH
jgi:prophage regulatory protein